MSIQRQFHHGRCLRLFANAQGCAFISWISSKNSVYETPTHGWHRCRRGRNACRITLFGSFLQLKVAPFPCGVYESMTAFRSTRDHSQYPCVLRAYRSANARASYASCISCSKAFQCREKDKTLTSILCFNLFTNVSASPWNPWIVTTVVLVKGKTRGVYLDWIEYPSDWRVSDPTITKSCDEMARMVPPLSWVMRRFWAGQVERGVQWGTSAVLWISWML